MNRRITLNFEDGVTRFIHTAPDETATDTTYRQDINIPLDCCDGACGTCKCLVEAGRYTLGQDYIDDALSAEEAARGYVLTCQMRAESGYVLRVLASSALYRTGQAHYEAHASGIRQLSPSAIGLLLRGEALASLALLPGQYVNLQVPGSEQCRAYSFSSPAKDGEASFLIRNVPDGLTSDFLSGTAKAGDSLTMDGLLDSFYLREIHRLLLMLAGGTGLASFTAVPGRVAEQGSAHPLHLVCGVTHDIDLVRLEYLGVFAGRIPGLTWSAYVTSAGSDYPRKSYVTEHIAAQHLHEGDVDIYLCRPPPVVEAVERYLHEQGVRPASFYYKEFTVSAA